VTPTRITNSDPGKKPKTMSAYPSAPNRKYPNTKVATSASAPMWTGSTVAIKKTATSTRMDTS
jgi:hypothetical protein